MDLLVTDSCAFVTSSRNPYASPRVLYETVQIRDSVPAGRLQPKVRREIRPPFHVIRPAAQRSVTFRRTAES